MPSLPGRRRLQRCYITERFAQLFDALPGCRDHGANWYSSEMLTETVNVNTQTLDLSRIRHRQCDDQRTLEFE